MGDDLISEVPVDDRSLGENTGNGSSAPSSGHDLSSTEKGSLTEEVTADEEQEVNFVKGIARYSLAFGLICSVFVTLMDVTILATAIPRITSEFRSIDDVGWYGAVYELSITALQPSYGKLYTIFSLKWVFITAMVLFEIGSVIAATATSSVVLIVGRAISGMGSAGVFSGALAILASSVPMKVRARYIGLLTSMFGIASVIGPFLGGVLTDKLSWRWCFWINLPLGGTAIIIVFFVFRPPKRNIDKISGQERLRNFDFGGSILLISSVTCLLLMLQWGGIVYPWSNSKVYGVLIGFILLAVCFVALEFRLGERATVPLRLLKNQTMWSASLLAWASVMTFYNHVYYLPFYFQAVKDTTAEGSGIRSIPYFATLAISSISTGFVVAKVGTYVEFAIVGTLIWTIAAGLIATIDVESSAGMWVGYQMMAGFGSGLSSNIPFIAIQATTRTKDIPLGMAIVSFCNSLGGALTISVGQNILVQELRKYLPRYTSGIDVQAVVDAGAGNVDGIVPPNQLKGTRDAYAISLDHTFSFAIAAGSIAFLLSLCIERKRTNNKIDEGEKAEGTGSNTEPSGRTHEVTSEKRAGAKAEHNGGSEGSEKEMTSVIFELFKLLKKPFRR